MDRKKSGGNITTRNVFINDDSLMTIKISVTELALSMTKMADSSLVTSDGALARRTMTKTKGTSLNNKT
jgi:hypothetical protein